MARCCGPGDAGGITAETPLYLPTAKLYYNAPNLASLRALDIADGQLKWQVSAYNQKVAVSSADGGMCILLLLLWLFCFLSFFLSAKMPSLP